MSDWNISFIKQCWRYLHSGEASVDQKNWTAGIPLNKRTAGCTPSHHYFVTWFWQILIFQIIIHSDVQTSSYFCNVAWPHCDHITTISFIFWDFYVLPNFPFTTTETMCDIASNLSVNKKCKAKENFADNQFHNILRLFNVLPNFPFTTS